MGKENKEHLTSYRPMPQKSRFWLYSEHCYTEEDLTFRQWILKTRANSGIHADYLTNPSSWFADEEQALINVYEKAWFYSNAFKTRHVLNRDDFHVQPVDGQRLQWPALYDLMQKVGDYLLLRNQELPPEHLNQPMNFVFLDLNNMLKGLSQNTNIEQVKEQLELITKYLRTIEKNISPLVGSDRLFLANFRRIVDDEIHPQLTHKIEAQLLRERLGDLSRTINKLSIDRNRILHFALNTNKVNPHPYHFSIERPLDTSAYPTQAAKDCGSKGTDLVADPAPVLQLTQKQLEDCPNFKLISMDEEVLSHYAQAISDLNELDRFQKVVTQTMDLLGQAGEVYTIHQFKEQMLNLFNQIDSFIDSSAQHVDAIIYANTQAYHKAIQEEQDLPLLKKWFSSEKEKFQVYIKNQDTLAQFPSSNSDLAKTNKLLKAQVNQVISHLSQPKSRETSFEAIADRAQELDTLMGSMHQWIKIQKTMKGLAAPEAPLPLKLMSRNPLLSQSHHSTPPPMSHFPPLFSTDMHSFPQSCSANTESCPVPIEPSQSQNNFAYLGLVVLIPVGLIALYLLLRSNQTEDVPVCGTKKEFKQLKIKFEDLLTQVKEFENKEEADLSEDYEMYLDSYKKLLSKADSGIYYVSKLQDVFDDLEFFYQELRQPNEELDF